MHFLNIIDLKWEKSASFLLCFRKILFILFKISIPFEEWAVVYYDSEENIQMNKDRGIICLYTFLNKDNQISVILIEQVEEGKSKAMFEDPEVKPLIEGAGHIYDTTVISSYF